MTAEELLNIFKKHPDEILGTSELYTMAIKEYHIDNEYDDYEKHLRGLQQTLSKKGLIENLCYGYWRLKK